MKQVNKNKNEALIAIVDDDASVCEALESLLKSIGFRTASFSSGSSFLDSPELLNVSCVILDITMLSMDGLELQRHLASTNPIPIIFVTAHGDEKTRERALRAGAISFLNKPFSDQALIDSLHSALDEQMTTLKALDNAEPGKSDLSRKQTIEVLKLLKIAD